MQTSDSPPSKNPPPTTKISSDKLVDLTMKKGLEEIVAKTAAGLVIGGVMGFVFKRVGFSSTRRVWAGLGAGVGLGSGWAKTSIELEKLVGSEDN